jgi:peptidoglycan/xylan/chitin deacetylase (PgdA/CDA1 family)
MKRRLQRAVRALHLVLFRRPLPEKLAVYCHSTAGHEYGVEQLLGFLNEQGYTFKGPGAFLSTTGKVAFVSFDDNYRSWLRLLPILDRHRLSATFYVNSGPFRDRANHAEVTAYLRIVGSEEDTTLSTRELKEIAAAGHAIGSHTRSHPVLTALSAHAAREEIRIGKTELEAILERPVEHFSYPFGMRRHFSESLRSYCRSIGFVTIANAIPCLQYSSMQPDRLQRSVWYPDQSLAFNLQNVSIDGRMFHLLTGRSAAGGSLGEHHPGHASSFWRNRPS